MTGLYPKLISLIFEACCEEIVKPRINFYISENRKYSQVEQLSTWNRLLMVLCYLRTGFSLRNLANMCNLSHVFCFRELRHIIPILLSKIRVIRLFDTSFLLQFPFPISDSVNVHGAIDCTSHRRDRVHPGQYKLYKSDKHFPVVASHCIPLWPLLAHFYCEWPQ